MKCITKALAASAALLASGSALAIPPGDVPAANRFFISGATATNAALYELNLLASGGLCAPGSIDVFIDVPDGVQATDADDQFLVACNGRSGTAFAGQAVLLAKESNGGSFNGTIQVARSQQLAFINPDNPGCASTINVAAAGALTSYTLNRGCANTVNRVPAAGIADVEAALSLDATDADIAILNASALFQIIFAPAVSENLYRALQAAQGLPQDDLEDNVPNITRAQLSRIFNGEAFTWDEFLTQAGVAFDPDTTNGIPSEDIYVCRRGNQSGTQASFASFVLNERCNATVPTFVVPDDIGCLSDGCDWTEGEIVNGQPTPDRRNDFIFAGDGSSDVRACLDSHNDQGTFAIGVLSTNTSIGSADRQIRFVGVDGAAPTLREVANGGYHFVTENVLNVRGNGPSGVQGQIVDFIIDNIGNPGTVAGLNVGSRNPGGDHGVLGRAVGGATPNTPPVSEATMRGNPISSLTRSVLGTANNCAPVTTLPNAQIIGGNQ